MADAQDPSRRGALKQLGSGIGALAIWPYLSEPAAAAFEQLQATQAPPTLAFLTADQYAAIDAIADAIIPSDAHSPGARAARVADYIDLLLSESDAVIQKTWTSGLATFEQAARTRFQRSAAALTPVELTTLLTDAIRNEGNPQTPLERFFKDTKDATIRGYYTSEIGIQQDLNYQGNRFLAEFVGCTHPEHGYDPTRG